MTPPTIDMEMKDWYHCTKAHYGRRLSTSALPQYESDEQYSVLVFYTMSGSRPQGSSSSTDADRAIIMSSSGVVSFNDLSSFYSALVLRKPEHSKLATRKEWCTAGISITGGQQQSCIHPHETLPTNLHVALCVPYMSSKAHKLALECAVIVSSSCMTVSNIDEPSMKFKNCNSSIYESMGMGELEIILPAITTTCAYFQHKLADNASSLLNPVLSQGIVPIKQQQKNDDDVRQWKLMGSLFNDCPRETLFKRIKREDTRDTAWYTNASLRDTKNAKWVLHDGNPFLGENMRQAQCPMVPYIDSVKRRACTETKIAKHLKKRIQLPFL